MKALITGYSGFVGKYLATELRNNGYDVTGTDISGEDVEIADLLDTDSLFSMLKRCEPDVIFHLAGQAAVGLSWQIPRKTFDINVGGTINLLDSVRQLEKKPRILIVGSSDQYGIVKPEDCPIRETLGMNPQSPYAISKMAQEKTAVVLAQAYGIDIVLTRSFNHIGPGQKKGFVIADFCAEIAAIESGRKDPVMHVGNLSAKRDFTDVRDVVQAYRLLIEKGQAGQVYNIGSGSPISIQEILEKLLSLSKSSIQVDVDASKLRALDVPIVSCCYEKLHRDTGWSPTYIIADTLRDVLYYFRSVAQ